MGYSDSMKVADFRQGYSYRTEHSTGYSDLGNKGPQPNNSMKKGQGNPLSLQGSVPAGWEHYDYASQGASGYGRK